MILFRSCWGGWCCLLLVSPRVIAFSNDFGCIARHCAGVHAVLLVIGVWDARKLLNETARPLTKIFWRMFTRFNVKGRRRACRLPCSSCTSGAAVPAVLAEEPASATMEVVVPANQVAAANGADASSEDASKVVVDEVKPEASSEEAGKVVDEVKAEVASSADAAQEEASKVIADEAKGEVAPEEASNIVVGEVKAEVASVDAVATSDEANKVMEGTSEVHEEAKVESESKPAEEEQLKAEGEEAVMQEASAEKVEATSEPKQVDLENKEQKAPLSGSKRKRDTSDEEHADVDAKHPRLDEPAIAPQVTE